MPATKIIIPPQEPRLLPLNARLYYGTTLKGEHVPVAKITWCHVSLPGTPHGIRLTVWVRSHKADTSKSSLPAYTRRYGRYIEGELVMLMEKDSYNRDQLVITFEPSAKHLDRFEEPKYFE